jgi:hypothetical protein
VDPPADITWTATADGASGAATSTKINLTFAGAVTGLTAEQITLTNGTGTVTKGAISGDGANWSLGLTVETAGDITVAIDKAGVESGAKTVTVHKQAAAPAPVAYTVTADGESGATTSTKIDFVFNAAVEGLTAEQITLTNGTGTVTKGDLTGSGASWSLEINVEAAGDITVAIDKPGIASGAKTITVHIVTDTVRLLQGEGYEWAAGSINGEEAAQTMTLAIGEEPLAYFAIGKTAAQTIAVSNDGGNKVTQAEEGETLGGETASDTVALFSVNMEDLLFDGAFGSFDADAIPTGTETRAFTLTVTEEGKDPRTIAVSLNITLDPDTETSIYHREGEPGNYRYVKVRNAELTSADTTNHAHSTRNDFAAFDEGTVKDLQNAFVWVDHYGLGGDSNTGFADGTTEGYSEYRLFLKKSQQIGKIGLMFNNRGGDARNNMSVELYGAGRPGTKELKITRNTIYSNESRTFVLNHTSSGMDGFITLKSNNKNKALVLGKNIIIDAEGIAEDITTQFRGSGEMTGWYAMSVTYLICINDNSMLIMNNHSKLTGCYVPSGNYGPVYLGDNDDGQFYMYGGAITGNTCQYIVYGLKANIHIIGGTTTGNAASNGNESKIGRD